MKILAYGDCHLREYGSFPPYNIIENNGLTKELNNTLKGFRFVEDKILEHKPDLVVNLGDLYTVTETVSTRTLYASSLGLGYISSACKKLKIPHHYVCGQHEVISETKMINSVANLVGYFDEIHTEYRIEKIGDKRFAFIPHLTDNVKMTSCLVRAQEESDLIFCHANFYGSKFENGAISTNELSSKLKVQCISGDIHISQTIHSVIYPGSLVQHRFSRQDMDGVGGVLVYEDAENCSTYANYPNTYSKHYLKVTDLNFALKYNPEMVLLQIHTAMDRANVEKLFEKYEHWIIPVSVKQEIKKEYINDFRVDDPKVLFRSFIANNNPVAVDVYDRIFGEQVK